MLERLVGWTRNALVAGGLVATLWGCGDRVVRHHYIDNTDEDTVSSSYFSPQKDVFQLQEVSQDSHDTSVCQNTFFPDKDDDGYGVKENPKFSCEKPEGYSSNFDDCNDFDKLISPSGLEICNSIDDDCDEEIDEGLDCCSEPGEIKDILYCPPYDFVFVVDNSGSMDVNDPSNIRYEGLHGFVDKMDLKDRGLVVPFATYVVNVGHLTSDKKKLHEYIEEAKSALVGSGTDIGSALMFGITQFEINEQNRAIILLTDGQSVASFPPFQILQEAQKQDVRIYALGLGNGVDTNYLQNVATANGGYFFIAAAEQIPFVYDEIIEGLKFKSWVQCSDSYQWEERLGGCK